MSTQTICSIDDLVSNSGVCAIANINGVEEQVALFYVPESEQKIFALNNWDPLGAANVLSRGIIGSIGDQLVVASPLYKQHFSLLTGKCLEESAAVKTYPVKLQGDDVILTA